MPRVSLPLPAAARARRAGRRLGLALLLALAVAPPLFAYNIVLKDGSTIVAKEKYKISGKRALITLLNGTQSFLDAAQIDVQKTEGANRDNYGSAVVIENGEAKPTTANGLNAPPPRERTLADLIKSRGEQPRDLPSPHRETRREASGTLAKTKAGYLDLATLPRKPFAQLDAAAELQQFFHAQGIEEAEVFQGSEPDRPLIEIVTSSEAGVFRALAVAANALLRIRDAHPRVGSLELLLATPTKERAGQFVLTPQMASDLVAKNVEVTSFYLANVQF
jgi:hypothetical protein